MFSLIKLEKPPAEHLENADDGIVIDGLLLSCGEPAVDRHQFALFAIYITSKPIGQETQRHNSTAMAEAGIQQSDYRVHFNSEY